MIAYKFTHADFTTRNKTLWGPGITHTASGNGPLCTSGWIHAYTHPLIAVFMNPQHGGFKEDSILWECGVDEFILNDNSLKFGTTKCTTIKPIEKPVFTHEQLVRIAIKCASIYYHDPKWVTWANNWLQNIDRTAATATAHATAYATATAHATAYAAAIAYAAYAATIAYAACAAATAAADYVANFNILECIKWGLGNEETI